MSTFMQELTITAATIFTALGFLWAGPVEAACVSNNYPAAYTYTQVYPDGAMLIQIDAWDMDIGGGANMEVMYNSQGQIIPSTIPGMFSAVKPAKAWWHSGLKNVGVGGCFVGWVNGPTFSPTR